mgnify:CR=1 FL=1
MNTGLSSQKTAICMSLAIEKGERERIMEVEIEDERNKFYLDLFRQNSTNLLIYPQDLR